MIATGNETIETAKVYLNLPYLTKWTCGIKCTHTQTEKSST